MAVVLLLPRLPSLTQENTSLRSELTQRQLELAQLREALRHTRQGQALTEAVPSAPGVVAGVIARSTLPSQQTILMDKGSQQGVKEEGVVVDAGGVVGRVAELHGASALVMLLTDPESRVAAIVERSRETGLLVGRGLGQCELIYLDAQVDLQEGDRVLTAGLGGVFPKGLLLGKVTRVFRDEQAGSASAWVEPAARLGQLEEVLCLLPAGTMPGVKSDE